MTTILRVPSLFSPPSFHLPSKSLHAQKLSILSLDPISIKCSSTRVSHVTYRSLLRPRFVPFATDLGKAAEAEEPEELEMQEGTLNIKLPRRSLIVHFTCDACGERTQRTINRVAYERGTVFVQCAGCLQHHKLVDNLGLVVEYDFREERNSNTDSV